MIIKKINKQQYGIIRSHSYEMPSYNSAFKLKTSHERSHQRTYFGYLYIWRASLHIVTLTDSEYIRLSQNASLNCSALCAPQCRLIENTFIHLLAKTYNTHTHTTRTPPQHSTNSEHNVMKHGSAGTFALHPPRRFPAHSSWEKATQAMTAHFWAPSPTASYGPMGNDMQCQIVSISWQVHVLRPISLLLLLELLWNRVDPVSAIPMEDSWIATATRHNPAPWNINRESNGVSGLGAGGHRIWSSHDKHIVTLPCQGKQYSMGMGSICSIWNDPKWLYCFVLFFQNTWGKTDKRWYVSTNGGTLGCPCFGTSHVAKYWMEFWWIGSHCSWQYQPRYGR